MNKSKKLTAILSGLLVGMSLRALAERIKGWKPSAETVWLIALIVAMLSIAVGCCLWALGWI